MEFPFVGRYEPLRQEYEYKFIRLGEGLQFVRKKARLTYRDEVEAYAKEGWRLVQIFAPSVGGLGGGTAKYYELILERRVSPD
jgi:hypothetical protein